MSSEELKAEFESRAIQYSGGLMLLRPDDAIALVRRAAESRVGILGVDGIFVTPSETVSPLEHTVDFSDAQKRGAGCWARAEHFIDQRREQGLVFEVTLGEHLDQPT